MPDDHTNPNGYTVKRVADGGLHVFLSATNSIWHSLDQVDALRDFLLDELGLWRDPETGALIMTGSWNGAVHCARVIFPDGNADGYADAKHPDRYDEVVTRWRATIAPPPREPQPGEVWRITRADGLKCSALVLTAATGALMWRTEGGAVPIDAYPPNRRRILVEADGTVVSDE